MVAVYVTSISSGAGKTAICASIARHLAGQGKKVGYMRAVIGGPANGDGMFMKDVLSLPEAPELISPAFASESQLMAGFKKSLDTVGAGKDVVLIEGSGAAIARASGAKAVIVAAYSDLADSKLAEVYKSFGSQAAGVVINKVPVKELAGVRKNVTDGFSKVGIPLLGFIPEDRALLTFTIAELVKAIDGQVVNNPEKTGELALGLMLGAMTVDSALPYYNLIKDKVAIIRSERPDMQNAALETSTRAIVITGEVPIIPQIRNRAVQKNIPLITTTYDVATTAGKVEDALVKTRFHQKGKLPRLDEITAQAFDFAGFRKTVGL